MFKKLVNKVKSTAKKAVTKVKQIVKKPAVKKAVKNVVKATLPISVVKKTVQVPTKKKSPTPKKVTTDAAKKAVSTAKKAVQKAAKPKTTAQAKFLASVPGADGKVNVKQGLIDTALLLAGGGVGGKAAGTAGKAIAKKVAPKVIPKFTALVSKVAPKTAKTLSKVASKVPAASKATSTASKARPVSNVPAPYKPKVAAPKTSNLPVKSSNLPVKSAPRPLATTTPARPPAVATPATGAGAAAGAGTAASRFTQAGQAARQGISNLGTTLAGAGGAAVSAARQYGPQALNLAKKTVIPAAIGYGAYQAFKPQGGAVDDSALPVEEQETLAQPSASGYDSSAYGMSGSGGYGDYGMGGMGSGSYGMGSGSGGGDAAIAQMQQDLFSIIDQSAAQNSSVTTAWLNQMNSTLDQLQNDIIAQYQQQGKEVDPATMAALQQIRDTVNQKRSQLMEDMNRRGLLQSGVWLEEENRLLQGQLNSEEQLLAGRLSDIQNRLTQTMQDFANTRMNIMGTAYQNEMQNSMWQGDQRMGTAWDLINRQDQLNQWGAEYGLDLDKFGLSQQKEARMAANQANKQSASGQSAATKKFIEQIPSYGSLNEALSEYNKYRGEMITQGADAATILQNIYAYFGV